MNTTGNSLRDAQMNAPDDLYERAFSPPQAGRNFAYNQESISDNGIRLVSADTEETDRLFEEYSKDSGRTQHPRTEQNTPGYSNSYRFLTTEPTYQTDSGPAGTPRAMPPAPSFIAKAAPPLPRDVPSIEKDIRANIAAAEHGDAKARNRVHDEIYGLSWQDRKQLAANLESDYWSTGSRLVGGVSVDRDVIGNVRSITFNPSALDRMSAWKNGDQSHAIEVTSPTVENYNAQPGFYDQVKSEYYRLPLNLRQLLVDNKYVIATGHSIIDASPDLAKETSPELKGDYNHAEGLHLSGEKRILVVEKSKLPDDKWVENYEPKLALRHEIGHAVDHLLGSPSQTSEFKDAYDKDSAAMSPATKKLIEYYQQKAPYGEMETFAQLFGLLTRAPGEQLSATDAAMLNAYRRTVPLVQKYVDQVSKPAPPSS